jgi:hypothetical protein
MRPLSGSCGETATIALVSFTHDHMSFPKTIPPVLLRGGRISRPSPLDAEDAKRLDNSGPLTARSFSDDDRDPPKEETDHVPEVPGVRRP